MLPWRRLGADGRVPSPDALRRQEASRLLAAGMVVGALGGVVAWAFDRVTQAVGHGLLGTEEPSMIPPVGWMIVAAPALAGLAAGLLIRFFTQSGSAQGISDLLARVQVHESRLSMRDGIVTAVAAALVVGGGQSGGREGPIVQASAALAGRVAERLGVRPADLPALLAAGAAAGIAASFDTPLGGAFFALEIILGSFAVEAFAPVVAATVTGTVVGEALLGDRVALHLPPFVLQHPVELFFYLVLGAASAGVAWALKQAVVHGSGRLADVPMPSWLRPGLAGLGVGLIAWLGMNPVMGNGYAYVEALLAGKGGTMLFVTGLLAAKVFATMLTSAGRVGAGLFAPSLFVGAVTGTLFGMAVQVIWPGHTEAAGAYGMVGMGAVAAAVMSAPITMTLMLFEMTGNYQVILPLLLSLSVAGAVSASFRIRSIYEMQLERRGVVVSRTRESAALQHLKVADLLRADGFETVRSDEPMSALVTRFLARRVERLHVLDDNGRYLRTIDLQDVKGVLAQPPTEHELRASDLSLRPPPALRPHQTLASVLPSFYETGFAELPVIDSEGRLVGILAERDVMATYHRESLRTSARHAHLVSDAGDAQHDEHVELPQGQVVQVVDVGTAHAGRTLAELRLPAQCGCTVLAISAWSDTNQQRERLPADATRVLDARDRLVLVGPQEQVERLARVGRGEG